MIELWKDAAELALATAIAPLLSLLPGIALLWLGEHFGYTRRGGWDSVGIGGLLAIAIFPAIDALLVRWFGLAAVTILHLCGGLCGLVYINRLRWSFELAYFGLALFWWVLVLTSTADIGTSHGLNQSFVVVDLVKHAAVVETIVRDGLPLADPFFFRPERAGYYYYYYIWPAQIERLCGGAVSGRMAYTGVLVWTGPAFLSLFWRLCLAGGLIRRGRSRKVLAGCVFLAFVAGADFPAMLWRWGATGVLEAQTDTWTEEIRFSLTSMLWTPHHLAALVAVWVGVLAVIHGRFDADPVRRGITITGGGLALSTAFGMSVWIALTAGISLAIWAIFRGRRDAPVLVAFAVAGAIALVVSIPQFIDLALGRSSEGMPIGLNVRMVLWFRPDLVPILAPPVLLLLPTVYAIEFGVFAYGAALFRRLRPPIVDQSVEQVRSLLLFTAIGGLLVATFLRSTILNNDLGWRAPWFTELACIVWTASVIQHMPGHLKPPRAFIALLLLGMVPNIYDVVALRVIRPPAFNTPLHFITAHPVESQSLRIAYLWANDHLPNSWVLQHEAATRVRTLNFGLYGRFRTGVADREATLFGASPKDVYDRITRLRPLFESDLPADRIAMIARDEGIDALVYTSADPIWQKIGGPPAAVHCVWRDAHACIAPITNFKETP